jgi:hypothetical protein
VAELLPVTKTVPLLSEIDGVVEEKLLKCCTLENSSNMNNKNNKTLRIITE